MNYRYLLILLVITLSCSKDNSIRNGLFYGSSFYPLDNTFFYASGTGANSGSITTKDFLILLTDGQIESFSLVTNDFEYTPGTTSSVLLILRKYSDEVLPVLEIPDGVFNLNVNNPEDSILRADFDFECNLSDNFTLESCINSFSTFFGNSEPISGNIEIRSLGNDIYQLNYEFQFADIDKIEGSFKGEINKGNTILNL